MRVTLPRVTDLKGRAALVTGAGSGIGRAIALELSAAGAAVALLGRTRATLEAVAGEAPGSTCVVTADVADRGAVDAAFARVAEALGPLHIAVANAGVGGPNDLHGGDRWDEIVRTNLDGAYFTLRAFERHLASGDGWKHAIVISSCVARFGVPGISAYSAAKAGQLGLVRSLAAELAPKRVLVNAICPGWVETRMAVDRMTELGAEAGQDYATARADQLAAVPPRAHQRAGGDRGPGPLPRRPRRRRLHGPGARPQQRGVDGLSRAWPRRGGSQAARAAGIQCPTPCRACLADPLRQTRRRKHFPCESARLRGCLREVRGSARALLQQEESGLTPASGGRSSFGARV